VMRMAQKKSRRLDKKCARLREEVLAQGQEIEKIGDIGVQWKLKFKKVATR
jgi:hypothetical protein